MRKYFDLSKVIMINLSTLKEEQILAFSKYYNIYFDTLMRYKNKNYPTVWVWTRSDMGEIIAVDADKAGGVMFLGEYGGLTTKEYKKFNAIRQCNIPRMYKSRPTPMEPLKELGDVFPNMKVVVIKEDNNKKVTNITKEVEKIVEVIERPKTNIILELDVILDKISEYGIGVLTKEEKNYLDSLSK